MVSNNVFETFDVMDVSYLNESLSTWIHHAYSKGNFRPITGHEKPQGE